MSIATVVTMGYGSFGSVNLLPTIGYSSDSGTPITALHCGSVSVAPRYSGTVDTGARYSGTADSDPRYSGTVEVSEC